MARVGFTAGVPDPDGTGPIDGTDSTVFIRDADPGTVTDPLDADTDNGGVMDGTRISAMTGRWMRVRQTQPRAMARMI